MSKISLKFLVSNTLAGSLIGTGGNAIKEMIEVTEARVTVSSITDVYPGTSERIILLNGTQASVDLAQNLLWDMLAMNAQAINKRTVVWSPKAASEKPGEYDEVEVSGKITVPASAGGLILGRGGASLKSIGDESGAKIAMTSKEEAMFTQERILTISGTTGSCAKCVSLIVTKLAEDPDAATYVNRGTTYTSQIPLVGAAGRDNRPPRRGAPAVAEAEGDLVTSTKITLTVPDNLVGNILGRNGVYMREIMSLSGAKVTVSPRGEKGDTESADRTVTITGSPACAQTAHLFITQKLQNPSTPPTRGPRKAGGIKAAADEE